MNIQSQLKRKRNIAYCGILSLLLILVGCESRPVKQGQQYINGEFSESVNLTQITLSEPVNIPDYEKQVQLIESVSPSLYGRYKSTYEALNEWIAAGAQTQYLNRFGLSSYQLAGTDNYGNVHLTGYYTPVLKARHKPDSHFQFPLYGMPQKWSGTLPSRAAIYEGALDGHNLELAYTDSLIDNFIMEVQGSGYIDFENGEPLTFFSYKGKNGHSYQSIGRLLIEQGEIERDKISMQAIKAWADQQEDTKVRELLVQNASVVFFHPQLAAPVVGSTGIPLVAKASVASDRSLIPSGSVLLVEVPQLDENGQFNGERQLRLMVALDIGSAIKGQHLDIYQGIGEEAGELAGFYNHYGRVWVIKPAEGSHLSPAVPMSR
ncbi:murein transglycosylase A [Zophobihabitans entericus]|uniref:peptidoglycan lytic exotransglycosylase n=1 Tax=Zophobihabitans entericus TaxID=1635327 RepID=A0A6G9IB53_9GAMM|nr:murein transglycosylase A [Zophobihabitans entericus]QIQ20810.1 murein transglycosylase A [Zophobihabitans entericus]